MEYILDFNKCVRSSELPRLIQHSIINHASGDPIIRNLEVDFNLAKPRYPKDHKKTMDDRKREMDMQDFKRDLLERTRTELLRIYREDSEYFSLAVYEICKKCPQNNNCENYLVQNTAI